MTVAEGRAGGLLTVTGVELQWGRNLTVAEGASGRMLAAWVEPGFNGAAT